MPSRAVCLCPEPRKASSEHRHARLQRACEVAVLMWRIKESFPPKALLFTIQRAKTRSASTPPT
jgi:hypothetical protein